MAAATLPHFYQTMEDIIKDYETIINIVRQQLIGYRGSGIYYTIEAVQKAKGRKIPFPHATLKKRLKKEGNRVKSVPEIEIFAPAYKEYIDKILTLRDQYSSLRMQKTILLDVCDDFRRRHGAPTFDYEIKQPFPGRVLDFTSSFLKERQFLKKEAIILSKESKQRVVKTKQNHAAKIKGHKRSRIQASSRS